VTTPQAGKRTAKLEFHSIHENSAGEILSVQRAVAIDNFNVNTLLNQTVLTLEKLILLTSEFGKSPLVRDSDVLATGKLVASTAETFANSSLRRVLGTNGKDDLTNVNTSNQTSGLAESTTHTGLESICSGT